MTSPSDIAKELSYALDPVRRAIERLDWVPDPWQARVMRSNARQTLLNCSRQSGKRLSIETPIATPSGWTTMADIRVGDRVLDERGRVCSVTYISPVVEASSVRVSFSDSTAVVCDPDHLWTTFDRSARVSLRIKQRDLPEDWVNWQSPGEGGYGEPKRAETRTALELAQTLNSGFERNHAIPSTAPLQLPCADLPIDPYTLGSRLVDDVSGVGIPAAYLRASFQQRLRLLQGLMDTAAYAEKPGGVEIVLSDRKLVDDVLELLTTFGILHRTKEGAARFSGEVSRRWSISFTTSLSVFSLSRKAARLEAKLENASLKRRLRYITSVEPNGPCAMRCISVDSPSHLYLAGRQMVPTHNSTTTAAIAAHCSIYRPGSLILMVSKAQRQSADLLAKVQLFLKTLADPPELDADNMLSCRLANGSRIISLPGDGDSIRGFSAPTLIIEDEASFVDDRLYAAVRPMLAVSQGRLILMSTPHGRRGHFWEAWSGFSDAWVRESITAYDCPRISQQFLEQERRDIGEYWFQQEYLCRFVDSDTQLFSSDSIGRAFRDDLTPLSLVP
ncbi:MAG: hypothetical protein ACJ8AW_31435 [Rhodopila sp.]